uniref:Hit family protein n=1 Tax=Mammaliicoccus stepanovicii TaxID=643214 RepID=A0A0K2JNF0_9STAP|nr:hit family protein [Mammaliicoccus stepanovicii]
MHWKENRILSAKNGTNPMVIKELKGSYVVFGDVQFLPGYCELLPKREVRLLNDLTLEERQDSLLDMSLVGDAMIKALNPTRVNYEILGNKDHFLHAHLFPRYEWEDELVKYMPVWAYDGSNWSNEETAYDPEKHDEI